jgi:WD40 repeat protein
VWNVDDWQPVATVEAKSDSSYPSPVAFSSDGRRMAVLESHRQIRLLDATSFAERARFTLPEHCFIQALCFTPDGSRLIAGTFRPGMVYIWDLPHIRADLAAIGLDWAGETYKIDGTEPIRPLEIRLELGEMAAASKVR